MAQFKSKKAIVDTLKQQIQSNPKQAVRALLRIYENQNESEREYQCTMFNMTRAGIPRAKARGRNASSQIISQKHLTFPKTRV